MIKHIKNQEAILAKLGISQLNTMQQEALRNIGKNAETILLSPTGTGKTLAFLLPLIAGLDSRSDAVQALILVPARELAIQIEQVARDMGSGYSISTVYGGRSGSKERQDLKQVPAILIGTPGRVADHFRRDAIEFQHIKFLVLDEFDKSLEIGFENDMREILEAIPQVNKKILTSATQNVEVPDFVKLSNPKRVDFLATKEDNKLAVKVVFTSYEAKLEKLFQLLVYVGKGNGIVFCNFKESITELSKFLNLKGVEHGCFFGGMEQIDRERVLIKFRNGTIRLLIATDLAARGLDIPDLDFIIHFELPQREAEFTHRNGRTARMLKSGTAYVLQTKIQLPEYLDDFDTIELNHHGAFEKSLWATLFISGGRKDKISKGDIAGLLFKQGNLQQNEVGVIELKSDCSFVAIPRKNANSIVEKLNNQRLKTKKVRISILG